VIIPKINAISSALPRNANLCGTCNLKTNSVNFALSWQSIACIFNNDSMSCLPCVLFRRPGMLAGSALVGIHMAMTHGVTIAMMASYIPTTEIQGIGKVSGTCWSFTDFIFGKLFAILVKHGICESNGHPQHNTQCPIM
jgi:hypothetical protein